MEAFSREDLGRLIRVQLRLLFPDAGAGSIDLADTESWTLDEDMFFAKLELSSFPVRSRSITEENPVRKSSVKKLDGKIVDRRRRREPQCKVQFDRVRSAEDPP